MTVLVKTGEGQVICIKCYDQNDSISASVNNLIINGSFENGCPVGAPVGYFCPSSTGYSCNLTGWTCTGGGTSTYAQVYGSLTPWCKVVEGTKGVYFGNNYCEACSSGGDTSCLENTACTVSGIPPGYPLNQPPYGGATGVSIEQTVNGLVAGNIYVLEFWAGGEQGSVGPYDAPGVFAADVGFGDTLLRNHPTYNLGGIGTRYIVEFIAAGASQTIKFTNWGHVCDSCTELALDDVRLYTLAELAPAVPSCLTAIDDIIIVPARADFFPNPVINEVTFNTTGSESAEIILSDIASRQLLHQQFIKSVTLNTTSFAKGIYFFEMRTKNGVVKNGKLLKE